MNVLNIIGRDKNLFDKDIIVFQNEINKIISSSNFLVIGGVVRLVRL